MVVDLDDHELLDERRAFSADAEARVDRLGLERIEQPGRVGEQSQRDRGGGGHCEQQPLLLCQARRRIACAMLDDRSDHGCGGAPSPPR